MPDDGGGTVQTVRVNFSLRLKIILTFLIVGMAVSGLLSVSVYSILNAGLLRQMQGRVLDLARVGTNVVDTEALARLRARIARDLPSDVTDRIESSADFRIVSDQLNRVRGVESKLVRYIYTFAPTDDPRTALYIVDGDVLRDKARQAAGEKTEDISHFSSVFDISQYPVAERALASQVPLVEDSWSWDPDFKVNSITGYAPVFARNGTFVGVLAMDMVDTDVRAIVSSATTIALAVVAAALALTVASSILLGTLFTHGIITLDKVVRTFDKDNMNVRSNVRSRDEVGRLSISFNHMAETIQEFSARQAAFLEAYGKFVPHEFLRLLEKGSILDVKLGDQTQKDMTVLFSDIRSFTTLSESMTPEENFNFINSYLRRMGPENPGQRRFHRQVHRGRDHGPVSAQARRRARGGRCHAEEARHLQRGPREKRVRAHRDRRRGERGEADAGDRRRAPAHGRLGDRRRGEPVLPGADAHPGVWVVHPDHRPNPEGSHGSAQVLLPVHRPGARAGKAGGHPPVRDPGWGERGPGPAARLVQG